MPDGRTPKRRRSTPRPLPERFPWLRYDRAARAVTERLRVRPVPGQPFWVLAVRNPVHHTQYHVLLPEYPDGEAQFCSCPDFARRGIGTCKHIEAATTWLAAHPEIPRPTPGRSATAGLWRAIDSARQQADVRHPPRSIRLRAPGRLLFEPRGSARLEQGGARKGSDGPAAPTGD